MLTNSKFLERLRDFFLQCFGDPKDIFKLESSLLNKDFSLGDAISILGDIILLPGDAISLGKLMLSAYFFFFPLTVCILLCF